MSALNDELLKAVELALAGDWDAAHHIVQQHDHPIAAWLHAVLHKVEGDLGNAKYWYHRANKLNHLNDDPKKELATIQAEIDSSL